jgi:hypothetical protein
VGYYLLKKSYYKIFAKNMYGETLSYLVPSSFSLKLCPIAPPLAMLLLIFCNSFSILFSVIAIRRKRSPRRWLPREEEEIRRQSQVEKNYFSREDGLKRNLLAVAKEWELIRGRPLMTSRNSEQFLLPPSLIFIFLVRNGLTYCRHKIIDPFSPF